MNSALRDAQQASGDVLNSAALTLLLEQLPDAALCLLDAAGVIEQWHPSAQAMLGHVAAQIEGRRLETLLPEERRFEAELPRALFEASAHGRARSEAALMTRTGQRRVCILELAPRLDSDDDVIGFVVLLRASGPGSARDVAPGNDNLVVAHRLNLTRAADDPAWLGINLAGRVIGLGASTTQWLNCTAEDTVGRDVGACIDLRETAGWTAMLHRAVRSQGAINCNVAPVDSPDRPSRTARLLPLRDPQGRLDGFTLLIEADRPVAVKPSGTRTLFARASDRAGVLAAAHDLREPLRKMQHSARHLQTAEAPRLSDSGRRQLESLQSAADRMQGMIGGMLRLARIDTDKVAIDTQEINRLIDEVRTDLALLIDEHAARFDVGALGTIRGDAALLRALFQNLIDNSIRYCRADAAPHIRIAAVADEATPHAHVIEYVDNSRGFERPDTAFQPFQRSDESERGTGIGLSLCRRICQRHGGELSIVETGEAGTRFRIVLEGLEHAGDAEI